MSKPAKPRRFYLTRRNPYYCLLSQRRPVIEDADAFPAPGDRAVTPHVCDAWLRMFGLDPAAYKPLKPRVVYGWFGSGRRETVPVEIRMREVKDKK